MKYSYYPGCTLKNKAKDLDEYARASAKALGFEMEEIKDWQCCGGVYPLGSDEIATKLSSVRALNDAKEKGQDLITVTACPLCMYNLRKNGNGALPVYYFTELLAEALGVKEEVAK